MKEISNQSLFGLKNKHHLTVLKNLQMKNILGCFCWNIEISWLGQAIKFINEKRIFLCKKLTIYKLQIISQLRERVNYLSRKYS